MNRAAVFIETIISPGILFYISLIVFSLILFFAGKVIFLYVKKKKIKPALVVFSILLLLASAYLFTTRHMLKKRAKEITLSQVVEGTQQAHPPARKYEFLKKHSLVRDSNKGIIQARDSTGFTLTLSRNDPRQVFADSFYIMMSKEGKKFETRQDMLDYAWFVILMYYGESEPIMVTSPTQLIEKLKNRNSSELDKISSRLEELFKIIPKASKQVVKVTPYEAEWDLDPEVMSFNDNRAATVVGRIYTPTFWVSYDSGTLFRLYTFSLRYKELVEWQFKIFKTGEIWVKKLYVVKYNRGRNENKP
ncbi:MAG: hypothetical protein ACLFQV_09750 [Vulcanimicrobiota bacterium]